MRLPEWNSESTDGDGSNPGYVDLVVAEDRSVQSPLPIFALYL